MFLFTKSYYYLFLFFFCASFSLQAQPLALDHIPRNSFFTALHITGKVVDADTGVPLDYATISLFKTADQSLVDGNITDEKGQFKLEVRSGNYYATIEFLAYQKETIENIEVSRKNGTIDLGTIALSPETAALEEVIVTAEKSEMVMALDKKVFNVGKDLSSRGGNAADLLDNVPSVQVDIDGNVSLRGNQSVRILVNGKPSGLVDDANGLRSLQANMIERIEIITNPSARYEGEGTAGILNIILKKNQAKGFNGSFDLTAGYPTRYGVAASLNYRAKKLNFFTNYGINYRKGPGVSTQYQELFRNDTTFITQQNADRTRGGLSNNFRFGADYFFNAQNTLTTAFNYQISDDKNFAETIYEDFLFNEDNPTETTVRTDDEREDETELEYALTYRKTFDEKDREFVVDLRYQDEIETEGSDLVNKFYNPDFTPTGEPDVEQRSDNTERSNQLIVQADYVHPFSKDHRFEAGLRTSIRNIDNDYLVQELTDGEWESLEGLSNNFEYDENIGAAYAQYGNKFNKFSFLLGFRLEYSQVSTKLLQTNEINDRDYFTPIPTLHLTYDLPQNNAVQASYSRRLRRPRFWDLNPFFTFSDDRNFFSGNPNLNPEFTDAMELGHVKYWDKGSLSSSIYYRHTTGKIERIPVINDDGTSTTMPQNLSTQNAFGFEFNTSYKPYRWWRMNADFNFFREITEGAVEGRSYDSDTYSWSVRGTARFTIKKKTDIQIRYNYRAAEQTVVGTRLPMYSVNIAASRDILKDKGTLTLNVRDVFNSRRWRYTVEEDNVFREANRQWRARSIVLTLNYRLNQKKKRGRPGGGRGGNGGGDGEF